MRGPWIPEPRECDGHHVTIEVGVGIPRCRFCGRHSLPAGKVSKNGKKRTWPPFPEVQPSDCAESH
jgi:hypothetical protein